MYAVKYSYIVSYFVAIFPYTFVCVDRRNNAAQPGPHRNVGRGFIIPSIYAHKRMRNRFRLNVENTPQNIRGLNSRIVLYLQCIIGLNCARTELYVNLRDRVVEWRTAPTSSAWISSLCTWSDAVTRVRGTRPSRPAVPDTGAPTAMVSVFLFHLLVEHLNLNN